MERITHCDGLAETDICRACEKGEGACDSCDFQKLYDRCFYLENQAEKQFIEDMVSGKNILLNAVIDGRDLRLIIIDGNHESFIRDYLDEHAHMGIDNFEYSCSLFWGMNTIKICSHVYTQLFIKLR